MIPHLILCGRLLLFSCQMYLESSVSFWYLILLMDFVWFRNLILNSLAVTPMYVFVSLLCYVGFYVFAKRWVMPYYVSLSFVACACASLWLFVF